MSQTPEDLIGIKMNDLHVKMWAMSNFKKDVYEAESKYTLTEEQVEEMFEQDIGAKVTKDASKISNFYDSIFRECRYYQKEHVFKGYNEKGKILATCQTALNDFDWYLDDLINS